ncbi:ESX secretion-associated protein EspG [Williamsia sp. 1135]|uniref:ESX secretion-associated protein EspG n=1 Tax=Williamsia sp. 1135 TaxID=1889262 RepID=UPI001F0A81A3|nr:ESX secretion-associated protein EspG [Williamsia sp. 1135]
MWTMETAPGYELTDDHLDHLGMLLGHQTWPLVLAIEPGYEYVSARDAALSSAVDELTSLGILCDDPHAHRGVAEPLADALSILANPEMLIETRVFGSEGCARSCLARQGPRHVLARRTGVGVEVREVPVHSVRDVGAIVTKHLGVADTSALPAFSAPAGELRVRLDRARSAADYSDALHAMGAGDQVAAGYAAAFESCTAHAEIVAIESGQGRTVRSAGAVAIYDTARGRILAGPSTSPDGRIWTTLSGGSPHKISQAVELLVETLPSGRWLP